MEGGEWFETEGAQVSVRLSDGEIASGMMTGASACRSESLRLNLIESSKILSVLFPTFSPVCLLSRVPSSSSFDNLFRSWGWNVVPIWSQGRADPIPSSRHPVSILSSRLRSVSSLFFISQPVVSSVYLDSIQFTFNSQSNIGTSIIPLVVVSTCLDVKCQAVNFLETHAVLLLGMTRHELWSGWSRQV